MTSSYSISLTSSHNGDVTRRHTETDPHTTALPGRAPRAALASLAGAGLSSPGGSCSGTWGGDRIHQRDLESG